MESPAGVPREPLNAREALWRGWHKRCPHCGVGDVFIRFNRPYRHCPVCGYLFGSLMVPLVLTIPRRYGLAFAITYLSRKHWPDANDPMPPLPISR